MTVLFVSLSLSLLWPRYSPSVVCGPHAVGKVPPHHPAAQEEGPAGASGAGAEGHRSAGGQPAPGWAGGGTWGGPGGRAASAGFRTSVSKRLDSHWDTEPPVNRDGTRQGGQAEVRWSGVGVCSPYGAGGPTFLRCYRIPVKLSEMEHLRDKTMAMQTAQQVTRDARYRVQVAYVPLTPALFNFWAGGQVTFSQLCVSSSTRAEVTSGDKQF